ncbi:MAG: Rrf2 family transcriptional regulator [Acidimicrobiia bacterium]|nr:Rrf2 family transcriptional regulator [Acidimicrobiia bacterium]
MKLSISSKTELALAAVRELTLRDSPLKGAELAALLGTTASYLPHVVRPLVRRGWIESDRGPTGGYRLIEDPAAVSLYEFLEAVEGPMEEDRCVLRDKACEGDDLCALHEPWLRAREALFAELRLTTLADLDMIEGAA